MIDKYVCKPLGVSETPLGFNRKCLELIPAFGGIIQGIIGASSQESANRANLRATRETNEMNYKIAQETNEMSQQQFQKNMEWLREQYYDMEQYKRLVQSLNNAGLNPALALGNVSPAGSVGSPSQSNFHAAHMEAGHVEPVNYADGLSESVGHAVDAYYNNQLRQAEAKKVGYDAMISRANAATAMRENVEKLRSMRLDNEQRMKNLKKSDKEYERLQFENESLDLSIKRMLNDWDEMSKQLRYGNQLLEKQNRSTELTIEGQKVDNALRKIELAFKPQILSLGVKMSQSQINLFNQQASLVAQQCYTEFENGQIANKKSFEQTLRNRLLEMESTNKTFKSAVRDNNKITRIVYWYADYFSDLVFGNLGKILK